MNDRSHRLLRHTLIVVALFVAACSPERNDWIDAQPDMRSSDAGAMDTNSDVGVGMDTPAIDASDASRDGAPDVAHDVMCPDGGTACGTSCANLLTDGMNCGRCGTACGPGQLCRVGSCAVNPCPSGQYPCPGGDGGATRCVNVATDPTNCGTCGTTCPADNECAAGMCLLHCATGQVHCGATCSTLSTDPMNCGSCGHACGAGQTCQTGTCVCMTPMTACGTTCSDTRTDTHNCGTCGHDCGSTSYCAGSLCVTCLSPSTLCPGGVCTNTMTDARNCGACGMSCPTGNTCSSGTCICPTGSMVCSGTCVNLQTDSMHCGTCTTACPSGNVCIRGACSSAPLYHGWTSPIAGCDTTRFDSMAATALGGNYPYNAGDTNNCRAWKLAATVCNTMPVGYGYTPPMDWSCPTSGGFTDPVFGTFCAVSNQYACSDCYGACNASCAYNPLSLRNCSGSEVVQP